MLLGQRFLTQWSGSAASGRRARRSRSGAGINVALTTHERLTGLLCRRRHEHGLPADVTITAPTGSWARRRETSRADVRPTHRATVRSDERARPPRRAPGRSSTNPPQAPGRVRAKPGHTRIHACTKFFRFKNPATPAKGTTCCRSFSIGNDLFTTMFTAQMGRGKIQWGAFTVCVLVVYF